MIYEKKKIYKYIFFLYMFKYIFRILGPKFPEFGGCFRGGVIVGRGWFFSIRFGRFGAGCWAIATFCSKFLRNLGS